MKRFLIISLFVLSLGLQGSAQEVFNQVVNTNKLIIDDSRTDALNLSVAQFKYAAMQYLCNMTLKVNDGRADAAFLDRQAYSMNQFITSYLGELLQAKGEDAQKEIMKRYWKASAKNSLFGDKDTETTRAFANDATSITPFSLDTNWELAEKAAKESEKK